MNILELIRRITRHPQKQAVQNDLDKKQSFNAFSAESKKAIKESGNIEISEIVNTEPKLQCKFCLNHCNPGIIYCVCGHLMVEDSGEHRKYMLSTLNSFTIGNFYIRKDRPRGYRYGKAPGCKEYHTAHQLAKKCRKKGYDSIYDRYMRDKLFRSAMIEHSRTEQVIIEMDNLANENHSFRVQQERDWVLSPKLVGTLKCGTWQNHANKAWTRIQRSVVNNATPEASGRQEEAGHNITTFFILVFMAMANPAGGESDYEHSPQKWYYR